MVNFTIDINDKKLDIDKFLEENNDRVKSLMALKAKNMILERIEKVDLTEKEKSDIDVTISLKEDSKIKISISSSSQDVLSKIIVKKDKKD